MLEAVDGSARLEVQDAEPELSRERLELLAIVRGLEALDQPSAVTIVTSSRYIQRGLHHGLAVWRDNDWQWERFGELAPVKNADLWRRVDHALRFHRVRCRVVDAPSEAPVEVPSPAAPAAATPAALPRLASPKRPTPRRVRLLGRLGRTLDNWVHGVASLWPKARLADAPAY